jgi:hypothetical protein
LSLFQPPDSRYWWYSFNFEGKRYRSSTKQTKKAAAAVVEATLLVRLREGALSNVQRKKPPTLREFSLRFLEWVESSQRLSPNGKRYYRYGWRLLIINQRNQRKKVGQVFGQVLKNEESGASDSSSASA